MNQNESQVRGDPRHRQHDADTRAQAIQSPVDVLNPSSSVATALSNRLYVTLGDGYFGGFTVNTEGIRIVSAGAGAVITGRVIIEQTCIFIGIHFLMTNATTELILVRNNAKPTFIGCTLEKSGNNSNKIYFTTASGADATLSHCLWIGDAGGGNLCAASAAVDIVITGGTNTTGRATGATNVNLK